MIKLTLFFTWACILSLLSQVTSSARANSLPTFSSGQTATVQQLPVQQPTPQLSLPLAQPSGFNPVAVADPLKPGDKIRVTVSGFPELSGEHMVTTNGTIQLPLAGIVDIGGMNPQSAILPITEVLRPYVRRPRISLSVLDLSPIRISVTGEVRHPGPRLLAPFGEGQEDEDLPPTLSLALVQAGGVTPDANLRNVIIRRGGAQPSELNVDLWQVIQTGNLQVDTRIYDGDEIVVTKATEPSSINQRTLLSSTVSPDQITVQVAGEVIRPGQLEISPFTGISGAVAAAGGPTDEANPDAITLLRVDPNGRVQKQAFAFGDSSDPLVDGDVIFVAESGRDSVGDVFDFLGRILNPFSGFFRLFN